MKKRNLLALATLLFVVVFAACSDDDNVTPEKPPVSNNGDTINIRGMINEDITWTSDKVYRLRGYVYVDAPATLTIEPGTKIISNNDSSGVLIIYKGAKIIAKGTAENPIVFTSGEETPVPGDFGGLILVGKATTNGNHTAMEGGPNPDYQEFGGNDDHDNSGILKYVRIEYAGKAVNPGDEVNGLSLYAVGDGTTIEYVQIIRGLDDAFEFFGGAVNCKYLIAYNCYDDDFDMDDGYHGKIQFAISIKDPAKTDKTKPGDFSNNIEADNTNGSSKPFTATPITHPLISNFTAIGPNDRTATNPFHGYNLRLRRGMQFEIVNSIFLGGQKAGLDIDNDPTAKYYKEGASIFRNNFLHAVANVVQVDKLNDPALLDATALRSLVTGRDQTVILENPEELMLTDPFNNATPDLQPKGGSPALTSGAVFENNLNDPFFEKVDFIGAIGNEDWTEGWTSWNK